MRIFAWQKNSYIFPTKNNEKRDNKQCLLDNPRSVTVNNKRLISKHKKSEKTRTVRGSDYSPAVELSEQKDKLVTENWRD